jgi:hypothetical protein
MKWSVQKTSSIRQGIWEAWAAPGEERRGEERRGEERRGEERRGEALT